MTIRPLTNTTKKPYDPRINYDSSQAKTDPVGSQAYNIACYNHDSRYSDPKGKSRLQCDRLFLADLKAAGVGLPKRMIMFLAVRAGGWVSWNRCRDNDEHQIEGTGDRA